MNRLIDNIFGLYIKLFAIGLFIFFIVNLYLFFKNGVSNVIDYNDNLSAVYSIIK